MSLILLIDDDEGVRTTIAACLTTSGHDVLSASSASEALRILKSRNIELVISDLRLPDQSGIEVLRSARGEGFGLPFILISAFGSIADAVTAMRYGASGFLEKPFSFEDLLPLVTECTVERDASLSAMSSEGPHNHEAHAAARWARSVIPVVHAPKDPRTIAGWGRWIAASPGAIRNWCFTARIEPRRSLLFARLLRAVVFYSHGRYRPEDLIDVVDRRTLSSILRRSGLSTLHFPDSVNEFFQQQTLIVEPHALREVRRAMAEERPPQHRRDVTGAEPRHSPLSR
jgi:FixJ family two-component response regulator